MVYGRLQHRATWGKRASDGSLVEIKAFKSSLIKRCDGEIQWRLIKKSSALSDEVQAT